MSLRRWETMNDLVDDWLPVLTGAETRLLWLYFRHASVKGRIGQKRNVCALSDRAAARRLAVTKQAVCQLRTRLIAKGVVAGHQRPSGRWVWILEPSGGASRALQVGKQGLTKGASRACRIQNQNDSERQTPPSGGLPETTASGGGDL